MNAFAYSGYDQISSPIKDHRSAEAQLLQRLTTALATASESGDFRKMVDAVSENQKFWQQIALDLAHDNNAMPDGLRASLLSLAGFTIRHSSFVLAGTAPIEPIIDINRHVIRGLMGMEVAA